MSVGSDEPLRRLEAALREKSELVERLEARVGVLEARLSEKSKILRRLAREVCEDDVLVMSWLAAGSRRPIAGGKGRWRWVETTELTPADVEATMKELWRLDVPAPEDEP